ncbi:hypothetical protein NQ315_012708 [Exocentrus adspersus]|uniref:Uncharacterized protein n=1 Tax=Exocentrus adspersus TaxID=1586481 RepID=A0AAV8VU09_9CUCU|nr:hypothetical protein NQ315_012708 [Exocentrus adspersus]
MEVDSQILTTNSVNIFHDTMFYDILSPNAYQLNHYNITESEDLNALNNNMDNNFNPDNIEIIDQDVAIQKMKCPQVVKLPLNIMPPPPHKIVNYSSSNNNDIKRYQPRDAVTRKRDSYRPISPRGYDSDESCTTNSSRGTPPGNYGVRFSNSRNGMNRLGDQTLIFGKYSQSSPNVYPSNVQYVSNTGQNGNYKKY